MTTSLGRSFLEVEMLNRWAYWNNYPTYSAAKRAMNATEQLVLCSGTEDEIRYILTNYNGPTNLRKLAAAYLGPQIESLKVERMISRGRYQQLIGREWSETAFYYRDFWGHYPQDFCPNSLTSIASWRRRVNQQRLGKIIPPGNLKACFNQRTLSHLGHRFAAYEATLRNVHLHMTDLLQLTSQGLASPYYSYENLVIGGQQARKACGGFAKLFLGAVAPALALSVTFSQIYESNPDQRAEVLFASVRDMFKPLPIAVFEAMVA